MIVTLTGPSCAGKSYLEKLLKQSGFVNAISTTSRPMRAGDVDGQSYYFTDRTSFQRLVANNGLVEFVEFGGHFYGLSVDELERLMATGKPIVVVCEPNGQKQITSYCQNQGIELFSVFVMNPEEVIADRFVGRLIDETLNANTVSHDKLRKTYARRLKEMMTTERGWLIEAYCNPESYDLILERFDEFNTEAVVGTICDVAGVEQKVAA